MGKLRTTFRSEVDLGELLKVWQEATADLTDEEIRIGVTRAIKVHPAVWFPTTSQFRAYAQADRPHTPAAFIESHDEAEARAAFYKLAPRRCSDCGQMKRLTIPGPRCGQCHFRRLAKTGREIAGVEAAKLFGVSP